MRTVFVWRSEVSEAWRFDYSLAQTDALSKLLIEKGFITQQEFLQKVSEERATYQKMFNPTAH